MSSRLVLVEGLPWVPARPTLGSRFFPGLCQVPVNKWCSLGSRVFLGFPWVPVKTQEVCPGFCQICGLPWVLPDLGSTPGSGRQEHRRAQRCVRMDTDSAAAHALLSLATGSADDAESESATSSKTQDDVGTASLCSRPVIISQPGQSRMHARHTPRTETGMYNPPPVGTDWTWNPDIIGADGAEAGPNGIDSVCKETDASYDPKRGHCSVHVERAVQQNKHNVFTGETITTLCVQSTCTMDGMPCCPCLYAFKSKFSVEYAMLIFALSASI